MKATVLTENKVLQINNVELPSLLEDECTVKIHSAGVCSSDINRSFGSGAYHYPLIMGHELAGTVSALGSKSQNKFKIGDRVAVFPLIPCFICNSCKSNEYAQCQKYNYYGSRRDGGFAEYLNVKNWNLIKIPDNVDLEHASMLEPIAVVFHALKRGGILEAKNNLVILGAGFLGLIAIRILKILNPALSITVLDRNEFKLELAKKSGAETVFLKDEIDWKKYYESNPDKFSFVLEACGAPVTYLTSLKIAARSSSVVWMGNISGDLSLDAKTISTVLRKEISILGVWNSKYCPDNLEQNDDWTESVQLLKNGLKLTDLITNRLTLEELPLVLSQLFNHKLNGTGFPTIKTIVLPHSNNKEETK